MSLSLCYIQNIFTALLCSQTAFSDGKPPLYNPTKLHKEKKYFYFAEHRSYSSYHCLGLSLCLFYSVTLLDLN